ncbi:hypothetical protein NMY22_g11015 [Coprinellus aureogranulatus]|nr:hypothetical protein NMY22_g11015 [Coprinellus aureogranulatus]
MVVLELSGTTFWGCLQILEDLPDIYLRYDSEIPWLPIPKYLLQKRERNLSDMAVEYPARSLALQNKRMSAFSTLSGGSMAKRPSQRVRVSGTGSSLDFEVTWAQKRLKRSLEFLVAQKIADIKHVLFDPDGEPTRLTMETYLMMSLTLLPYRSLGVLWVPEPNLRAVENVKDGPEEADLVLDSSHWRTSAQNNGDFLRTMRKPSANVVTLAHGRAALLGAHG